MQRWPEVPNADQTMPSTARSRSASSRTMIAFLPPELEVHVLEVVCSRLRHRDAGLARAGEGDHGHVRVAHERSARRLAVAVHDVDDAVRHAGLVEELDEALREERRVLGRLQHDGVAAHERRRELPRRNRDREVPRRDRADDADRHAYRHVELVLELGRRRLAPEPPALTGHVVRHVDRFLDVAARLCLHLSHLAGHQVGQRRLLALEHLCEAEEDLAAPRRRDEAPVLVGRARLLDRGVDSGGVSLGNRAEDVARRGAQAIETCHNPSRTDWTLGDRARASIPGRRARRQPPRLTQREYRNCDRGPGNGASVTSGRRSPGTSRGRGAGACRVSRASR